MIINTKSILSIISNQIADIINDDDEHYYEGLEIDIKEEQMFVGEETETSPNTIYVVVSFLPASIDYGQTAIPITFRIISEQNNLERTRTLFNEYAERYNLIWNEDKTMQQTYEIPSVMSSFTEIYEGFRTALTMPGAVLLIENGNDCTIQYYPSLVIEEDEEKQKPKIFYYDIENFDITKEKEPSIQIETFVNAIKNNKDVEIELKEGSHCEFIHNGYSWGFVHNNEQKIDSITIYDYGIDFNGNAQNGDKIVFNLVNGYYDLEYASLNSQASISLDSQAFYNNDGFTKSKSKFGSLSINITTFLFNNDFLNKCLSIYLRDLVREPLGIDTPFHFKIKFKSGHCLETQFKMASFSLQQRKGELPVVSATFTE
jgi:hypothetical protein